MNNKEVHIQTSVVTTRKNSSWWVLEQQPRELTQETHKHHSLAGSEDFKPESEAGSVC